MSNGFDDINSLLACPCALHGKLSRTAAGWVSDCCGRVFRESDGVLVLLQGE